MPISEEIQTLVRETRQHVIAAIEKGDATEALQWVATQPTTLVREAILATQPRGWAAIAQPLVASLTDEQAAAILPALVAVFVQR